MTTPPEFENPYGLAPFAGQQRPEPGHDAFQAAAYASYWVPAPRPAAVVVGAGLAIAFSGLTVLGAGAMAFVAGLSDMEEFGGTDPEERASLVFFFTMFAVLGVAAIVAAGFALRRSIGGRGALLGLGFLSVAMEVLMVIVLAAEEEPGAIAAPVFFLAGTVAALVLLLVPSARRWYASAPPRHQIVVPYR